MVTLVTRWAFPLKYKISLWFRIVPSIIHTYISCLIANYNGFCRWTSLKSKSFFVPTIVPPLWGCYQSWHHGHFNSIFTLDLNLISQVMSIYLTEFYRPNHYWKAVRDVNINKCNGILTNTLFLNEAYCPITQHRKSLQYILGRDQISITQHLWEEEKLTVYTEERSDIYTLVDLIGIKAVWGAHSDRAEIMCFKTANKN